MNFTAAQRATLKAFIQGDATLGPKATAGDYDGVATGLNAPAAGPFVVWQSSVPSNLVAGLITLATFTPADSPPASGVTVQSTNDALLYQNRALQCQLKQANILALVFFQFANLITAKPNVRQALNDGLTAIPSGASGANQDAGWGGVGGVRLAIQRNASVAEKVLASGTGTSANPGNLGVVDAANNSYAEGRIEATDIGGILA